MKRIAIILTLAVFTAAANAQTSAKTSGANPAATKSSSTPAASAAKSSTSTVEPWIKLPPGVPSVVHGPVRIPFTLRYEDIKVGAGAEGEPGKLWHIKYTGWRAADGIKFDASDDHKQLAIGPDGKPEFGPDGKPKFKDPEPLPIPQGMGHVIPGFDWGLAGMKIGGKRRIFIPWQLAYGTHDIPDRPDHPGIPAKSDLIFDVELVSVTDMPQPPQRPMMPQMPPHPGAAPHSGAAPEPSAAPHSAEPANPAATAPAQPATSAPSAPAQPATPAQPQAQPQAQPK